jgi:lysophospholipase L1-like esterase
VNTSNSRFPTRRVLVAGLLVLFSVGVSAAAAWQQEIDAFLAEDQAHPPVPGGVLFVGSSSIRMWEGLESQFPDQPVIVNRGFGGSGMADCVRHWRELVLPHRPRLIVVYTGENDLAGGGAPQDVARGFRQFVDEVQRALPNTRITYVSMKPSPSRRALMPAMRAGNAEIERFVRNRPGLDYVDVFTPMLDEKGQPRESLFVGDGLHMNASGYALWQSLIGPRLR